MKQHYITSQRTIITTIYVILNSYMLMRCAHIHMLQANNNDEYEDDNDGDDDDDQNNIDIIL